MRFTTIALTSTSLAVSLLGCSGPTGDGGDTASGICAEETRGDDYVAGLEKTGASELVRTSLQDALPAPPDVGENVWTLAAFDAAGGSELDGCTLEVTPWMVDHNHGSNEPVVVTSAGTGVYRLDPIDFVMPGYWETTIHFTCPGAIEDEVVYGFCAEG